MRGRPFLLTVIALLGAQPVVGGSFDNPPPLPGWTHSPGFSPADSSLHEGILLSGAAVDRSSPTIAEIDGDLTDGKEVAIGGTDGVLYVYKADGSLLWSVQVMPAPCDSASNRLETQPAVGDLDGDGVPEVVVGYGTSQPSSCDGGVAVYEGRTGQLRWRFSLRQWQQTEGYPPEALYAVYSSPALADTEGDGKLEIAFGGLDRNLYLLNYDGTVRWYYHAADTILDSPAFVSIAPDQPLILIVGTDISANPALHTTDGGYLYAFDTRPRWPARIEFGTGYLWRTPNLGQVIYSSPAIGDVLARNPGDEIVVGSGCFFPEGQADKAGKWVKIFRPSDGAELQTLEVPPGGTCVQSSPALGDIDDDGKLEVVVAMGWAQDTGGDGLSRIVAWDPETATPKWSTVPYAPQLPPGSPGNNDPSGGDFQSVVLADVDGNGSIEVLAANLWSVVILNGRDGTPLTCQNTDCGSQISLFAWDSLKSTPAIGDITGDGTLQVVIGGSHYYGPSGPIPGFGRGMLYGWTALAGLLGSPPGKQRPYSAPWPMGRGLPFPPGAGGSSGGPCDSLAPGSYQHVACELDLLRTRPPCALSSKVLRLLQRARTLLLQAGGAKRSVTAARLRRFCRQKLRTAGRRTRALPAQCSTQLLSGLGRVMSEVRSLG